MLVKKEFDPADLQRAAELLNIIRKFMRDRCYHHEFTTAVSTQVGDTQINFGYIKEGDIFALRNALLKPYSHYNDSYGRWQFKEFHEMPKILVGFINEGHLTFEDLEKFCFGIT